MAAAAVYVRDAYDWLQLLSLGGLVGALGQGVRTIVGIKKLQDAASATGGSAYGSLEAGRLVVSLAVGFIAGALGAVALLPDFPKVSAEQVFALAAAGYAGADFIEGFINRVSGTTAAAPGQDAKGVAPAAPPAAPPPPTLAGPAVVDDAVG